MKENILKSKSFEFAVEIVNLTRQIKEENREFELTRQLIRSGTAIGALIRESEYAETKKDFIHKLSIALKEANETKYWLDILKATRMITPEVHERQAGTCTEMIRMLTSSIKTARQNSSRGGFSAVITLLTKIFT